MNAKMRLFALTAAFLLLLTASCGKRDEAEDEPRYLFATVIETGASPLVEPAEGSWELSSADRIYIDTQNMSDDPSKFTLRTLRAGDTVRITYDGMIAETYPARINSASAICYADPVNHETVYIWMTGRIVGSEYSRPALEPDFGDVKFYLLQPDYGNDPQVESYLGGLNPSDLVAVCFCTVFDMSPQVIDVFRIMYLPALYGGEA